MLLFLEYLHGYENNEVFCYRRSLVTLHIFICIITYFYSHFWPVWLSSQK